VSAGWIVAIPRAGARARALAGECLARPPSFRAPLALLLSPIRIGVACAILPTSSSACIMRLTREASACCFLGGMALCWFFK
jgi:hypothetical protein